MKDKMLEFMAGNIFCVISTVGANDKPESAFVGFSHTGGLEIFIGTSKLSRKYANLQQNKAVAIVIADTSAEVQYEGNAEEITDSEYREMVKNQFLTKLPGSDKYRNDPNQAYLKITPTWVRFIKHDEVNAVEEFTEFA